MGGKCCESIDLGSAEQPRMPCTSAESSSLGIRPLAGASGGTDLFLGQLFSVAIGYTKS